MVHEAQSIDSDAAESSRPGATKLWRKTSADLRVGARRRADFRNDAAT